MPAAGEPLMPIFRDGAQETGRLERRDPLPGASDWPSLPLGRRGGGRFGRFGWFGGTGKQTASAYVAGCESLLAVSRRLLSQSPLVVALWEGGRLVDHVMHGSPDARATGTPIRVVAHRLTRLGPPAGGLDRP